MCVKKSFLKVMAGVLTLLLFAGMLTPAFADRDETNNGHKVRVGFYAASGYHVEENGERSGYGYEYLQALSRYTDWSYEYVGYDKSWEDMLEMLKNGEIDMLTSAVHTEDREKDFDYSNLPMCTASDVFSINAGDSRFDADDFSTFDGINVGVMKGAPVRVQDFEDFAKEKGFSFNWVYYDTGEAMMEDFKAGKNIDAIMSTSARVIEDEWVIKEFDASFAYVMVKKGNTQLMEEINHAMEQLNIYNPSLQTELVKKYFRMEAVEGNMSFTSEELAYINALKESGQKLKVLINCDRMPISYVEGGEMKGMIPEIAEMLFERTGLPYEFIITYSRKEWANKMEQGQADICFDMVEDYNAAERLGYKLTDHYMEINVSRLTRKSEASGINKVGLVDIPDSVKNSRGALYDESNVEYYPTVKDCVNAVLSGEQDVAYFYSYTAEHYSNTDISNRLNSTLMPGYFNYFCVGIKANTDPVLMSLIARALETMPEEDMNSILENYTDPTVYKTTLLDVIDQYKLPVILGTLLLFACILLLIYTAINKQRNLVKLQAANARMVDAVNQAERANEAKGKFLAKMSHEIRTPINAIAGLTHIALNSLQSTKKVQDSLEKIQSSSSLLLDIVNDVLDMSAIESNKMVIAKEPFDLKDLALSIGSIYHTQCEQKGVEFKMVIAGLIHEHFIGDSLRLEQILMNLVSNAYKFTPSGGKIKITLEEKPQPDEKTSLLSFTVADTGEGISEEMKGRIFKPFEQETAETAQKHGGSGLGLSITKSLVELCGGTISLESEKDKGATFEVVLPYEIDHSKDIKPNGDFDHWRIIVFDSDAVTLEYADDVLHGTETNHYVTGSTEDGLSVMERAAQNGTPYNIISIDWDIDSMNDGEFIRNIRKTYGKDVVIIVATYNTAEVREKAEKAGANKVIPKPVFVSTVHQVLTDLNTVQDDELPVIEKKSYDFTGHKVLLAEDNRLNSEIAKELLAMAGMESDHAWTGKEAVEMFAESEPGTYAAILMDIQMPELNGYEATKAIRELDHPEAGTIIIYAMSANAFSQDVSKAYKSGMNGHISKPIDTNRLYALLEEAVNTPKA